MRQAWLFLCASAVVLVGACAAFLPGYGNPWPLYLVLPTMALLAVYSYTKRVTLLAHFFLGTAIGLAPLAAWIAVDPASLGLPAVILSAAVLFWIAGFDIIYGCQDVEVDRRDGLFSIPAHYGIARALLLSRGCHLLTIGLLAILGAAADLGWIYWVGVIVTGTLLAAEQAVVRPHDLSRVNLAFFTMNGCISLLLGGAMVADVVLLGAPW